jgi:uncharacterized protein YndB with AHSA1/START domain
MLPLHVSEKLEIRFEIEIDAPPEKVWSKLATPEGMNEWFSKKLVFEPRLGGAFRMEVREPGGGEFTFFGTVVTIEPGRELAFTWTEHEKGREPWPVSTLVSFKLQPVAGGTRVTLTHTGFDALEVGLARREYEGHILGWERSAALADLKAAVEAGG